MKGQWGLIIGLFGALFIAIFSVINIDPVTVNYMIGTAEWPLVIVIISSALMGAILAGGFGLYRFYKLKYQLKKLQVENDRLRKETNEKIESIETKEIVNEVELPKIEEDNETSTN